MMKSRLLVWVTGEMALPDIKNGPSEEQQG